MLKYWHHHISTALTVKTSTACSEKGSRYIFTNILINWLCTDLNNFQDAATQTNCARGDTICICPCKLTISSHLFARWHLFRHVGYLRHQQQVDLWPFDLESGVRERKTWATSVPILVFLGLSVLELGPTYATDRQTSDRQTKASLNAMGAEA